MLVDTFGRRIDYLRLSITDRCDLRCQYCMPVGFTDYQEPEDWLRFDEIVRVTRLFTELGVRRVRLTGGEPLLRARCMDLIARIGELPGLEDLSLSTNGTRLARYAAPLRQAGVTRLNVSLDTLSRSRFAEITRRDVLPEVLQGLEAAAACDFDLIKINMVWLPELNGEDVEAMIEYCVTHNFVLRLIENMPMGDSARQMGSASLQPLIQRLQARYGLVDHVLPGGGPARYLKKPDGRFSIGFITPVSQHFCASCNRVRLAVNGTLHLCLGQEDQLELLPLMRAGASDDELLQAICAAVARKPEAHEFEQRPEKVIRIMSATGG